jgi:tetratricopeptide (TPR) repeat protein
MIDPPPAMVNTSKNSPIIQPMPKSLLRRICPPLFLAAGITILYAAASWPNQFVYDDHEVIENQYPIRHLNDLARIFREPHYLNFPYYRPITRATFALQMTEWGRNPLAYHLFNALLAGAVMLAAYALLRRSQFGLSRIAALLASLLFAVHPAFSECVYPAASGRETLLPSLFIILTMWAWLELKPGGYFISLLLFIAALLCKEQAAVLPGLFLVADILNLSNRPRTVPGWIARYLPIMSIIALYFLLRHLIFGQSTLHITILQHPLEPLKSLLYGLQTAVVPFMSLRYEPSFDVWFDWRSSAISLFVAAVFLTAVFRTGKYFRAALFWLAWFILLQLPTAHIVEQEAAYSERYAALALLALPAIAAAVLFDRAKPRPAALVASIFCITLLSCISFLRGAYYTNDASFCLQWENTNPDAAGPHDGFGRLAQERGEWPTAIAEYQKALTIQPNDATARNNLANLLADAGDFPGASRQYEWLLNNPASGGDPVATMTNYAQLLGYQAVERNDPQMRDRAHQLLEQAINQRPDYAQAHYILGLWNIQFGSRPAAIRQFNIALHLRPDWPEVEDKLQKLQQLPASQP